MLFTKVKLLITLDISRYNKRFSRCSNPGIVILHRGLTLDFAETKTLLTNFTALNVSKYRPEITPCLGSFHAVIIL